IVVFKQDITGVSNKCEPNKPLSVSVSWDHSNGGGGGDQNRYKVMGFVGIQTGFASVGRRRSLRKTWFPSDHQGLQRYMRLGCQDDPGELEESTGLAFRFVIGKTHDKSKMAALKKEVEEYDDFLLLDIEEEYSKLPYKTLAFFKAAYALFDSDFYERAARTLQTLNFRMFRNEDVTIGAWMLAMNVKHEINRQLCQPECTPTSIAVWDIPKCSGLCNPEKKLLELHQMKRCANSPT
ncbi:hypothetical protein M8C21_014980, partial [Ambrosia artemisiifolia]